MAFEAQKLFHIPGYDRLASRFSLLVQKMIRLLLLALLYPHKIATMSELDHWGFVERGEFLQEHLTEGSKKLYSVRVLVAAKAEVVFDMVMVVFD